MPVPDTAAPLPIQLTVYVCGRAAKGLYNNQGDPKKVLGSCFHPSPASAFAAIWWVRQQIENNCFFSICNSFQTRFHSLRLQPHTVHLMLNELYTVSSSAVLLEILLRKASIQRKHSNNCRHRFILSITSIYNISIFSHCILFNVLVILFQFILSFLPLSIYNNDLSQKIMGKWKITQMFPWAVWGLSYSQSAQQQDILTSANYQKVIQKGRSSNYATEMFCSVFTSSANSSDKGLVALRLEAEGRTLRASIIITYLNRPNSKRCTSLASADKVPQPSNPFYQQEQTQFLLIPE